MNKTRLESIVSFFKTRGLLLLLLGQRVQSDFQIGPTEEFTGPTVATDKVRSTGVLKRTGHSQRAGSTVLTQRRLPTGKTRGHIQLHHTLVPGQILYGAKITTFTVRTTHVLAAITSRHKLLPHTLLAQRTGRHLLLIFSTSFQSI